VCCKFIQSDGSKGVSQDLLSLICLVASRLAGGWTVRIGIASLIMSNCDILTLPSLVSDLVCGIRSRQNSDCREEFVIKRWRGYFRLPSSLLHTL
jgi:hypothetical protein